MTVSRRNFLGTSLSSLAYFSTAATTPLWISKSAQALCNDDSDRVLVIVQLSGGNDGLNTVIPYTDPLYAGTSLRPVLHITEDRLGPTKLRDGLNAFHPKLIRLLDWYLNGNVAVVQNVGYPNPNLSHFVATDFWELGTSPSSVNHSKDGWIARFFDNQCNGIPPENIAALTMLRGGSGDVPATLNGSDAYTPPSVNKFTQYQIKVPGGALGEVRRRYIENVNRTFTIDPNIDFMQRAANVSMASADDIAVASGLPALNPYPDTVLGRGLDIVSRVLRAGFKTRIFYVSQSGYDTHANQFADDDPVEGGDHPLLLDELDQALDAFLKDMAATDNLKRVLVMTFSEFGRRVLENGSNGTDHGTANSLFVMGGDVAGGVYGGQPDLGDLLKGNLKHRIDFRSVYSKVIQDWFGADPEPIFGTEDFNDASFQIPAGIEQVPFIKINGEPSTPQIMMPAAGAPGLLTGAGLALAAGALALRVRGARSEV